MTEDDLRDGIQYDQSGGISYHPDFHPNHGIPFSDEESEYLCYFWEYDDARTIAFALGKTELACRRRVLYLKQQNRFEYYKQRFFEQLSI